MNDCILTAYARDAQGYGRRHYQRKTIQAHRVAWIEKYGAIPDGLFVLPSCDNPPCVNIDHLWLGTKKQNHDDMKTKGRSPRGQKNGRTKLSEREAAILKRGLALGVSIYKLAKMGCIDVSTVEAMRDGMSWAWLDIGMKISKARKNVRKLTWENVEAIRSNAGGKTISALSSEFGVSESAIYRVKAGTSWK